MKKVDQMLNQRLIKLLDCTLRDGGYYNKWDFDRAVVDGYLKAIKAASIDIVELGFRSLPKNTFMGPYIYTTDEFINQLDLPEGVVYDVMINGKEFVNDSDNPRPAINTLFQRKEN